MAVEFTYGKNGIDLLAKLGVSKTVIDAMVANGISVTAGFASMTFWHAFGHGPVAGSSVKLPISAPSIMKGGADGTTWKDLFVAKVEAAVKQEINVAAAPVDKPVLTPAEPPAKNKIYINVTPADVMNQPVVSLDQATVLYQPVRGTSGESIYYVVAISPEVKIAARVKSERVSIRAVGDFSNSVKAALKEAGFDEKDGTYMSGHFQVSDLKIASRLLGAILFNVSAACHTKFSTPVPEVHYLLNKGS